MYLKNNMKKAFRHAEGLVRPPGFEPGTIRLKVGCSTTELRAQPGASRAGAEHSPSPLAVNRNSGRSGPRRGTRSAPVPVAQQVP